MFPVKDFSLLYQLTYPLVRYTLKVFYKKIEVKNAHYFPKSGPVLLCCTHTNAFIDPILMQTNGGSLRQIYSLARGDAFKKGILSWLLKQWKIIPIYRISEGFENLAKNDESFNRSYEVLERGNSLIMFPEGICVQEKRLRKLKKGAARIVFGLEERNGFEVNLPVVPVCVNYSTPKKFRSTVFVNYGKPLNTSDYNERYKQDKVKAINEFTRDLERAMSELYLHINNKENDHFVENVLEIYKPELKERKSIPANDLEKDFEVNRQIINAINETEQKNISLLHDAKESAATYADHLKKKYNLRDHLLRNESLGQLHWARTFFDFLILLIGLPVFLLALVMNYPPYRTAYKMANKIAKNVEFNASINVVFAMFGWLIFYGVQLLIIALAFHNWKLLGVYAALVPLTGLYAITYFPLLKKAQGRFRLFSIKRNNKQLFEQLINERDDVMGAN